MTRDKDEPADLAASILQQPALLTAELDWLASPEAQSAERLGLALGQSDTPGNCGRMIFEHAIIRGAAPLLRGYIRGLVQAQRLPSAELLALMGKLESTHPVLAVDILGCAGDSFDAFHRILRLVDAKAVSPRYLVGFARGVGPRELTVDEVTRLLPYFTHAATTEEAKIVLAGVHFLATYLLSQSRNSEVACLTSTATRSLVWRLVEMALPFLAGNDGYEWVEILKKLAVFDADRTSQLLAQALLTDNFSLHEVAESELLELAKAHPKSVMDGFGAALLDSERGWILQATVYRGLVGQLPPKIVLEWVRYHGVEACASDCPSFAPASA